MRKSSSFSVLLEYFQICPNNFRVGCGCLPAPPPPTPMITTYFLQSPWGRSAGFGHSNTLYSNL